MTYFCIKILYPSRQKMRLGVFFVTKIIYLLPQKMNDVSPYQKSTPFKVKKEIGCDLYYRNSIPLVPRKNEVFLYQILHPSRQKKRIGYVLYQQNSIPFTLKNNNIFLYQNSIPLRVKKEIGCDICYGILYLLPQKRRTYFCTKILYPSR